MEKVVRRLMSSYSLDHWKSGVTLDKMKADIEAMEKLGVVEVKISQAYSEDYLTYLPRIEVLTERMETDSECLERMREEEREAIEQERNRAWELEELERLKAKYKQQEQTT